MEKENKVLEEKTVPLKAYRRLSILKDIESTCLGILVLISLLVGFAVGATVGAGTSKYVELKEETFEEIAKDIIEDEK